MASAKKSNAESIYDAFGLTYPTIGANGPASLGPLGPAITSSRDAASDRLRQAGDILTGARDDVNARTADYAGATPYVEGAASVLNPTLNPLGAASQAYRHPEGAAKTIEVAPPYLGTALPGGSFALGRYAEPTGPTGPTTQAAPTAGQADKARADEGTRTAEAGGTMITSDGAAGMGLGPPGTGGAGGGVGVGGGKLAEYTAKRDAGLAREFGAYKTEKELEELRGQQVADAATKLNEIKVNEYNRRMDEAAEMKRGEAEVAARFKAFTDQQQRYAEDIGNFRQDPGRLLRNADAGTQFTMAVGSIISAGLAGMNNQTGNSSLDRLDKIIDRDIEAQNKTFDAMKGRYEARNTLLGQMVKIAGDKRVGEDMYRSLLYRAAKDKIEADAERLAIPAGITTAQIAGQKFEDKAAELDRLTSQAQLETYKKEQTQAAAAGRAAAQQKFLNEQMERETRVKEQEANTHAAAANATAGAATNTAIGETSKRLADDKVLTGKGVIEGLKNRIMPDGTIMGLGSGAAAKSILGRAAVGPMGNSSMGNRLALEGDELVGRQLWEQLGLIYQVKTTGTGGSDAQMEKIGRAFEGAHSPEERLAVVKMAIKDLEEREGLANTNLTDAQKVEFDRRRGREGIAVPRPVPPK